MPTSLRSFCKINLGLAVGPPRADGFHALTTCYQTLALHDRVTVSARRSAETRLRLTTNHPGVPTDERNTMWAMVAGALARLGVTAEVTLALDKRLPVQGGLGAGSANAAAALLGLEGELGVALPERDRLALAAEVGSDVPLFLLGGTVLGVDRGQEVYPLPDLPRTPCVVAVPEVGVSTAAAFRALDRRPLVQGEAEGKGAGHASLGLTASPLHDRLEMLSRALSAAWAPTGVGLRGGVGPAGITSASSPRQTSGDSPQGEISSRDGVGRDLAEDPLLVLVRAGIENDFEEVAFSQHPSLRSIKHALVGSDSGQPALYAALSGSGSALFGLYRSEAEARAAQHRVQQSGTRALLTETLDRQAYWATVCR